MKHKNAKDNIRTLFIVKDKADILMELEKHSRIKDELTEEVTRLNGLLEQERSRSKTGLSVNESHTSHNNKHSKEHKEKVLSARATMKKHPHTLICSVFVSFYFACCFCLIVL